MKTIGIISHNDKKKALEVAKAIYDKLTERDIEVLLPEDDQLQSIYSLPSIPLDELSSKSEAILSVGGDGTFLRAARYSFDKGIPILGINVGNLGFLTEVDLENIDEALENLLTGKYHLVKRMLLDCKMIKDGRVIEYDGLPELALNEITVTRSMYGKVIKVEIIVNDISIKKYAADGIIIATPTGSTAYSLSAGGPVVEPGADSIIITPICAHTLFSRSIILGKDKKLQVKLTSGNEKDMLSVDGKTVPIEDPSEYILRVERSEKVLNLISFNPNAFFTVFKEKFIERI